MQSVTIVPSDEPAVSPAPKRRKIRMLLWTGVAIIVLAAAAAIAAGPIMSRVEQPKYDVVETSGAIEMRRYGPMIAAETPASGERRPAIEEGFRRVAGYIFGGNTEKSKIAMTAPVVQQSSGSGEWTVGFIMPSQWSLDALPKPGDSRVRLVPIPARRMIAITFSGTATTELLDAKTRELRDYAAAKGLKVTGEPMLAFYNPPWTLPILRRNEVLLALEE
jgi:hypothetical protein